MVSSFRSQVGEAGPDRSGELQVGPLGCGLQLVEGCFRPGLEMRIPGDADTEAASPREVLFDPVDVDGGGRSADRVEYCHGLLDEAPVPIRVDAPVERGACGDGAPSKAWKR